jgi:hypothetical protein
MRSSTSVRKTGFAFACAFLLGGCSVLASKEAVVGCQAADTVTTLHALDLGAREANPVVEFLFTKFGAAGFIAAKIGVTLLVLHYYPSLPSGLVQLANGATCAVAAHNALIARELERNPPVDGQPPGLGLRRRQHSQMAE